MKKHFLRSLVLANMIGIIFVFGETLIRVFLSPSSSIGDLPIYMYNTKMSFGTLMGYSSVWMYLIAFVFSVVLGFLNSKNDKNPWIKLSYRNQVIFGWVFIVALEFISGYVLNIVLKLSVWDYSMFKANLMGQISVISSFMWLVLVPIIYWMDDLIRYYIWEEQHPDKFLSYYTDVVTK